VFIIWGGGFSIREKGLINVGSQGALRTVGVREALTQAFTLLGQAGFRKVALSTRKNNHMSRHAQGDVDMFMLCDNPCEPDDMSLP